MNEQTRPVIREAQDARQGEIILRTPLRKSVFFGGLFLIIVLAIVLPFFFR
jgi:hypothetical protein